MPVIAVTPVTPDAKPIPTKVSPIDYYLRRYTWRVTEDDYVYRNTSYRVPGRDHPRTYRMYLHREIAGLERGDGLEVHHINKDPLDNRRHNLVICTPTANRAAKDQGNHVILDSWRTEDWNGHRVPVFVGNPLRTIEHICKVESLDAV